MRLIFIDYWNLPCEWFAWQIQGKTNFSLLENRLYARDDINDIKLNGTRVILMWPFQLPAVECPVLNQVDLTEEQEDSDMDSEESYSDDVESSCDFNQSSPVSAEEFVFMGLLTGLPPGKMTFGTAFLRVTPPSQHFFYKALKRIESALIEEQQLSFERETSRCGTDVHVMGDSCWAVRGFKSPMGTTVFLSVETSQVIGVSVKINSNGSHKNYDGSARSMEGAGTLEICQELKKRGLRVTVFLHDGDGSSMKSVRMVFPECIDHQCINHWAKNIGKQVSKGIHKDYQSGIRTWVWTSARLAAVEPDPGKFLRDRLETCVRHHSGDHQHCVHTRDYTDKDVMTPEQALILANILQPYCASASAYAHGRNQSLVESFNHELSSLAPKDVPVASMYRSRVALAVLSHNDGLEIALPRIFHRLGLPMSDCIIEALSNRAKLKQKNAKRYQLKGKQSRRARKERTYERTVHTYKQVTTCNCQSKSACKNKTCGCRANKNECSEACGCAEQCFNKSTIPITEGESHLQRCLNTLHSTQPVVGTQTTDDLQLRSVQDLKALCKAKGIKGYSRWNKESLLIKLQGEPPAEAGGPPAKRQKNL